MDLLDSLKAVQVFSPLSQSQQYALLEHCRIVCCAKGEVLFHEGVQADGLYILLEGSIKIYRSSFDGREVVLHVITPGEMFGEVAVFQGGSFPANAFSLEESRCLFLTRTALVECIRNDPGIALHLLAYFARRLREFANKIEALAIMEAPQSFAAYLLYMRKEQGASNVVQLPINRVMVAGLLGLARETLSRTISRLVERQAIAVKGKKIFLLDVDFLHKLAEGSVKL